MSGAEDLPSTPNHHHHLSPSSQRNSSVPETEAEAKAEGHALIQEIKKEEQTSTSPNARSRTISIADGQDTQGMINRHPAPTAMATAPLRVGMSEDKNKKCRRTMEDSHAFIYDFAGVRGQGYFAIFDGHAGKHAAEWCGAHFHEYLLKSLQQHPKDAIPDLLNTTFHTADAELSKLAADEGTHSGCTAVTCFLRLEDSEGNALPASDGLLQAQSDAREEQAGAPLGSSDSEKRRFGDGVHRERLKGFLSSRSSSPTTSTKSKSSNDVSPSGEEEEKSSSPVSLPPGTKRTLYTANVGDARAVLCRGGKAVRLTYDHKGSDAQEAKRITDAGGFVMNNRVNGVLAVTRSLGDSAMKEFVVGSPYTTETTLGAEDDYLILACDGLWDVCEDQEAVDILTKANIKDPQLASRTLLDFALSRFSSDNLSVMVVALNQKR